MSLNKEQALAVKHFKGACIVTAAPGSGKTTVLTSRAISLIQDRGIDPKHILCLTFTNKAATEMNERVAKALGQTGAWISTFHRLCVVILRKFSDLVDLGPNFSIYTGKDQEELMSKMARMHDYDTDKQSIYGLIKAANDFRENAEPFPDDGSLGVSESDIINEYLETLSEFNAVDFSGILYKAWDLLKNNPKIQSALSNKFKFILVDEMQDTNRVQYEILKNLATHSNLFVVGDRNQAIYAFRGARPENIDRLRKDFDDVEDIVLPKNYRSTSQILKAAQNLIVNNENAKDVELHSVRGHGSGISINSYYNPDHESEMVVNQIKALKETKNYDWGDFAILYRANSLSRSLEICLKSNGIPYRMVGGFSFFDRAEIKTAMAYLALLVNPKDTISFARAVTNPKRQIGSAVIGKLERISQVEKKPILEVCRNSENVSMGKVARSNLESFVNTFDKCQKMQSASLGETASGLIKGSGYFEFMKQQCADRDRPGWEDRQSRFDNIDELLHSIQDFGELNPNTNMSDYLQSLELLRDIESDDGENNQVSLLTMHSAKGLEWTCVFIVGAEQNIIPHFRAVQSGEIDEERRLLFVAMTRAEDNLFISSCKTRRHRGAFPSSFLKEINV